MTIFELVQGALNNEIEKGFFIPGESRNLGETLMLVVSELGEALEADRSGYWAKNKIFDQNLFIQENNNKVRLNEDFFKSEIKDTVEDEIADAFIRLAAFCGQRRIDIEKHIELKMLYNSMREFKHGKNY